MEYIKPRYVPLSAAFFAASLSLAKPKNAII